MYKSRLTKPKVSEVTDWFINTEVSSPSVEVYYADIDDFFMKAVPLIKGYKTKYFYGETAWSDSRRYADDIHTKYIHTRSPIW
jgi:hypothetical protein